MISSEDRWRAQYANESALSWRDHQEREIQAEERAEQLRKQPRTEVEALRAFKAATILGNEAKAARLKAHADANGWNSLNEWETRRQERLTQTTEMNARIADRLSTPEEAAAASRKAWETNDRGLHTAITNMARSRGWRLRMATPAAPQNFNDIAAQLHEDLTSIIADHDADSRPWRDALATRRVTREYVAEQTARKITNNRERVNTIRENVSGFVNNAQAAYDAALNALTAPTGDTNEQLLAEIRAGKTWDRARRELEGLNSEEVISATLSRISGADASSLGTYIQELPSYLTSKGVRDAEEIVRAAVNARPELREVQEQLTKATKLRDVITHNTKHIDEQLNDITYQDTTPSDIGYVDPTTVKY